MGKGNFETAFHVEKRKPSSNKKLNFDTLKCGSCSGYIMVLWSASSTISRHGHHDFRVLPRPIKVDSWPEYWPPDVGRFWMQTHRNLRDENWDAAAVMVRSALQVALRQHDAQGRTLKDEIDDLATKGLLPPIMKDWASNVRELGNDAAHPTPGSGPTSSEDVRDVAYFLDALLEYLYDLPHRISQYRNRREGEQTTSSSDSE